MPGHGQRVLKERAVEVNVATGISDGQIIKITGIGETGERGAGAGDLFAHIKVKPHKLFERRGDDLVVKKEFQLTDILLEKPIDVVSISGKKLEVVIPPDFSLKNKLKMSGEGMPRMGGWGRGDLYIDLDIKTPKKLSSSAKKLLEGLL